MDNKFDIAIIGSGPAGISAALTAINRNKSVIVISNAPDTTGLWKAPSIENYPGITGSGKDIQLSMTKQLESSGATVITGRVLSVMPIGSEFGIAVGNDFYMASSVILALGLTRNSFYKGENEYLGKGVSYCATCDGMLYKGKTVSVIGEGEEVDQDIAFLKSIGCEVITDNGHGKIEIFGNDTVTGISINGVSYDTSCVFVLKSTISTTKLIDGILCENGIINVDKHMKTNLAGIFACGDCTGKPFQLAKAVGQGNIAALSAVEYIDSK